MSDALYLLPELGSPTIGATVRLDGPEARHAISVKRTRVGESLLLADGRGLAVRGPVVEVGASSLVVQVEETLAAPQRPNRFVAAQALAKGDRGELAVEMLTELGVDEVLAWQAARSIVRWDAAKSAKGVAKWASAAREATKQSRRFRVPEVVAVTTKQLVARAADAACVLVLHEEATQDLVELDLPESGEVLFVIGPEGGISPDELDALVEVGAIAVSISDGVLRTSTAGPVALARLLAMAGAPRS